jgi:hypothetical protein
MFGNRSLNSHALFTITNSVTKIRNEVSGKNNREIADAMSAVSRKNVFVDAFSELSKVTEFVFHVHKVYSVKLNPHGSDEDKLLLVKMIRSALRKFMRPVLN